MRWIPIKRTAPSPIGLDLGRCGVRAAQIEWRGGLHGAAARIRTACLTWLGSGRDRVGGSVAELAQQDPARLRRLLRQNDFRGRAVVVGLSSPEVELHALELPPDAGGAASQSLRQAAHWELERLMSFGKGEVESDYWRLPPSKSTPTTALGVAALKRDVEAVCRLCHDAGLDCRRVDASVCALSRFAAWIRALGAELEGEGTPRSAVPELCGVLDLGQRQSRLAVCLGPTPVVVRAFDTGGEKWISLLADALDLTPENAEIHLRDHGIQPVGRGLRAEGPAAPSAQLGGIIRNVLRPELESLCSEIERSYRYAAQCYPEHGSGELLVTGGGSEIRNLAAYFAERFGIPVHTAAERWTVLSRAEAVRTRHTPGMLACALGLAVQPAMG